MSDQDLIDELAVPHRARAAYQRLLLLGAEGIPLVRANLLHPSAGVRDYCCRFLDHFVDQGGLDDLVALLDDPDPKVRASSLHSLFCDRCKEGSCRPDEGRVLSRAIALMLADPDFKVREQAVGVVGGYVHGRAEAADALLIAASQDQHPSVRKKARMCAPGGVIYLRSRPKPVRKPRSPQLAS